MNKKLILSLGMVAFSVLTFASCKAKHNHTFGDSFQHDSNQHWHVCEKDGCNEVSGKENHHGGTATCTELAKCEDCGVSYGSTLSHSFTESKVDEKYLVSAADCDSSAVYYKSCVCGEKGTETFTSGNALGHSYATTYETDATHHWSVCTREGCTATSEKVAHSGGTATETAKAVCSTCGVSYGELATHQHDFSKEIEEATYLASAATCTEDAKYHYVCAKEGCSSVGTTTWTKTGSALGHDTETKHDTTQHWEECVRENCDYSTTKENHKGGSATQTQQAVCSVCNTPYGELATHEHNHTKQVEDSAYLASAATCTEDAKYYHVCAEEGCTSVGTTTWTKENSKLGHDMGEWSSVGLDGNKTQECSRCDHSVTEFAFGTSEDPITVDAALEAMTDYTDGTQSTAEAYISGVVVKLEAANSGVGYYKVTIANSASSTDTLVVFRPTFTGTLSVGDEILVKGKLKLYGTTYEVDPATIEEVSHKNIFDIAYSIVDEAGAVSTNATVSTIPATSKCCETINFTVTPSTGYEVEVFVNNSKVDAKSENNYSLIVNSNLDIKIKVSEKNESAITIKTLISTYATANNWVNQTRYDKVVMDENVTVSADPTTGIYNNTGKFYTNGNNWRIYQNEEPELTVTVKEGYELKSVIFTYHSENTGVITLNGTKYTSGSKIALSGTTVTFSVGNTGTATNGQARISSIEVTYVALSVCEHSFIEEVEAEDANLALPADCENAAKYYKVCEKCGEYSEETFSHGTALGHDYGSWTITVEPTETTIGSAERVCSRNNTHKETKELPVLTDTTVWTAVVTDPECGVKGKTTYTSVYGVVEVEIAALEHNYEGQPYLVSTEGKGGHYQECKLCGVAGSVEEHTGGTATETEQATCSVCNNKYGETLDHTHNYVNEVVHADYLDNPADCVNNATYYKSCSCGESSKGTEFEATFEDKDTALGHATADELDWIIEEDGHSKKCSCGHVVIEKAGHEGGEETCAVKAVCTVCGASYGELASEHAWGEWSKPTLAGVSTRVCANDATHKEVNNNAFGTKENPLTVAETKAAMSGFASGNKATVKGWIKGYVVSAEYTPYNGKDQWEYFIVDSLADTSSQFQLYGCYTGGVTEGDFIVATGYFKKYNSTYEFDYSNTVESIVHNDYSITSEIVDGEGVSSTNATISTIPSTAKSGETISFTITVKEGYDLTVKLNDSTTGITESNGTYSFVVGRKNEITIIVIEESTSGRTEEVIYTVGFESSEGFTATTEYNNKNPKQVGPTGAKWEIVSGTPSTSDKIEGSQSVQMRYYKSLNGVIPSVTSKFTFENATIMSFKAKNSANGLNIKVEKSTDGSTWTGSQTFTLSTSAKSFEYVISNEGETVYLRFVYIWNETSDGKSAKVTIDTISILGYVGSEAPSCEHEGGEATCKELAVCTKCGESYGELNVNNHKGTAEWTKDADSHKKVYSCCNKVVVAEEAHEWENGVCKECEYVCTHTERTLQGKEATCTEKGLTEGKDCSVCGKVLVAQEEIPMLDHTYSTPNYDNDNHWNECSCGAKENVEAHSHAYAYINENGTLNYVGTCECGHIVSEEVEEKEVEVSNEADLRNVLASGHNAKLVADIDLALTIEVTNTVAVDLNGHTLTARNEPQGFGIFKVQTGGNLTINGEGKLDSCGNNAYSIAVWARGGKVTINGGTYTNVGAHSENDSEHFDLIYVSAGGQVEINGGTFINETPRWTLNHHNGTQGTILVNGGKFYNFDPSNDQTDDKPESTLVGEGKCAVLEGDYYVVKAHNYEIPGYDNDNHWNECSCGAKENVEAHSHAYAYINENGTLNYVGTCECGHIVSEEVEEKEVEVSNEADLRNVLASGHNAKLVADIDLALTIEVTNTVAVDLNGHTLTARNEPQGFGIFKVQTGGNLTINGEGKLDSCGNNAYSIAVWARGGKVTINGGTYTNKGAHSENDGNHFDLIYVSAGGEIVINGGTFINETPKWTLNHSNVSRGTIIVNGGSFYKFDPSNDQTDDLPESTLVGEGKCAVEVEGYYVVDSHVVVTDKAVDADCVNTGLTEGSHCSRCNHVFVKQETIDALGHNDVQKQDAEYHWDECTVCQNVSNKEEHKGGEPTETEPGVCTVCNREYLQALGHQHNLVHVEAKASTCEEKGNIEYYYCNKGTCEDKFTDAEGLNKVSPEDILLPLVDHTYESETTAPTVDADGYTTFTCSVCGDEYVEVDEGTNLAKASVNGKNYLTVEEAIAAAKEGDTVKLVKDLTYKDILLIDESIILDGNNKTLTSTAGRAINVSGTLTVTIKNLNINCSGERGINLIIGPSIVTIENCNIKAANYAINLANSASGAEATILECEITGCNSVNVGAANSKVIIQDSVINSIDNITYEGYAAIALNKDGVNTEITVINTEINISGTSCEDTVKAKNHTETGKISIGSDSDNKIDVAFIEFGNYYYGYKTLAGAIKEAVEGQTVGLLRNVEVTESVVINKQIIINLRGFSITVAEGYEVENIFDVAEGYHVVKVEDTYVSGEHSYESTVTAPTCTAEGYTTHTCICGDEYKDTPVEKLSHTNATPVEENRVESTCTVKGSYDSVVYCSVCKVEISRTKVDLDLASHTERTIKAVAANCTTTGLTEGKDCSVCGKVLVAQTVVNALGHNYESVVTKPTCTTDGYTTHTCSVCEDSYTDTPVAATGHNMSEFSVTLDPTCAEAGEKTSTCANGCGHSVTASIDATGEHEYSNNWTNSTDGKSHDKACVECGDVKESELHYGGTPTSTSGAVCTICQCVYSDNKPADKTSKLVIATVGKDNGWTEQSKHTSINIDENITLNLTGGSNTGKYYNDVEIRIYQTENPTISIDANKGFKLISVKITYSYSNGGILTYNNSQQESNVLITVDASSVTFKVGNKGSATNGQVKITQIEVVYAVELSCTHSDVKENVKDTSGTTHSKICTSCGTKINTTTCSAINEATCFRPTTCSCGREMGTEKLEHALVFDHNDTHHWEVCTREGCDYKTAEQKHSGGEATETEKAICSTCHVEYGNLVHTHTYVENAKSQYLFKSATCTTNAKFYTSCSSCGESSKGTEYETIFEQKDSYLDHATANELDWKIDDNQHWKECICGHIVVAKENHTGGTASSTVQKKCSICGTAYGELAESKTIVFNLGADGSAPHKDGSTAQTTYSETNQDYKLSITGGSKMYPLSIDAKGNGCIKFGASGSAGKMTITVPDGVGKVIISVAGYKSNTAKISINGGSTKTISTLSDNGVYTDIEVDTSTNKTITFATVSGGYRCMVNSITFIA